MAEMIVKWTTGQMRTVRLRVNEWNGLKSAFGARPCFEGSGRMSGPTWDHHGNPGPPNWDSSSSLHYATNGAAAVDISMINGAPANAANPASAPLQKGLTKVPNIIQNMGPVINTNQAHKTHIHAGFKPIPK